MLRLMLRSTVRPGVASHDSRTTPLFWPLCIVILGAWAAVVCYTVPRHEPWADEAQAWQIAKTMGLRSLFGHYLHYEGSPGLWHGLLWVLSRIHITYSCMHWVTALIGFSAAALMLLCAPFPLPLRASVILTY